MASLFICGDVVNKFRDTQFIGENLKQIISACDFSICNLEGIEEFPEMRKGNIYQKRKTLCLLKEAGFDMMLLANNHITDYGIAGLSSNLELIKKMGLVSIGAECNFDKAYLPFVKVIDGIKFGFINICEAQVGYYENSCQSFGYAWIGEYNVDEIIKSTSARVDKLIVLVHAGLEHYQIPLRQFRNLYRHYCDLGASCVIASHPHIVQGIEEYNDSLIFYSLGNFYFPRNDKADKFSDRENSAFSVKLEVSHNNVSYSIINHSIVDGIVDVDKPTEYTDHKKLSRVLEDDVYETLLYEQNQRAFIKLPYNLYSIALNGINPNASFLKKIKFTLKLFFTPKDSEKETKRKIEILKRLIVNETYRFLTIDAINNYKQL